MDVLQFARGIVVEKTTCPVTDEGSGQCHSRADTLVVVANNLGVEAYLKVCLWHADLIETGVRW